MNKIKYIFGWIVFLEIFLSFGVIFYSFRTENIVLTLLILGQFLLVMGIASIFEHYRIGILLMIIGLIVFGIGSLIKWGYIFNVNINNKEFLGAFILLGIIISFIIFGIVLIVRPMYIKRKKSRYTLKVSAEVIDYQVGYDDGNKVACPILKYSYNNQEYIYSSSWYTNVSVPQKGSVVELFINPNDANDAFSPTSNAINIFLMLFGIVFFFVGLLVAILVIIN